MKQIYILTLTLHKKIHKKLETLVSKDFKSQNDVFLEFTDGELQACILKWP